MQYYGDGTDTWDKNFFANPTNLKMPKNIRWFCMHIRSFHTGPPQKALVWPYSPVDHIPKILVTNGFRITVDKLGKDQATLFHDED